ncbi:MAG: YbaN family protein [FCB group bacterium]|nr:YbaN family protein [FCB group bacterium]
MPSQIKNRMFIIFGFISLAVGGIGLFLPLLPTTPLILLAAYLFAKSSRKYHDWIRNNRLFGKTVCAWEAGLGFTKAEKWRMVIFATLFIGLSFVLCTNIVGRIVLVIVWPIPISVAVFTKTRNEDETV